jgi:Carboxypeptidase regulatory-like domain
MEAGMNRKQLTKSLTHPFAVGAVLLLMCLGFPSVQAQVTTSSILGSVTDTSGAAIPGAKVMVKDVDRNLTKTAVSNGQGAYRIDFLLTGNYRLSVSAAGFKTYIQNGISLSAGVPATVNAQLSPGAVTETVTVTSEAPVVNTSDPEIGGTVNGQQMKELPLVNRDPYTLLDLTPGVQLNQQSQSFGAPTQTTIINGGANNGSGSTNYYFDGAPNLNGLNNGGGIMPNPDALQEFRVQTSNYGAAFGRFPSGIVNAVVRSGTNNFHGTVFEFFRNPKLNAQPWGALPTDPKEPLHRNQPGATLGGPIVRDKVFFFGSYDGIRQTDAALITGAIVPTALERTGNFTQSIGTRPKDPLTGQDFQCNGVVDVICPNRLDQTALNLLKYVPASNTSVSTRNGVAPGWTGFSPNPLSQDEFLAKVNAVISPAHTVSVTYFMSVGNTSTLASVNPTAAIAPYSTALQTWRQQNSVVNDIWTISPYSVNNIWLSYTRMRNNRVDTPAVSLASLGSSFLPQGPPGLPNIGVTGYWGMRNQNAGPAATDDYALRDLVTWTRGKHTFQYGGEFLIDKATKAAYLNNYGQITFSGVLTKNALGDFLIGVPSSFQQDSPAYTQTSAFTYSAFVQDDYRVTPRLMLNLGLRYDVQTPPVERNNHNLTYIPGEQSQRFPNAPVGAVFPGDPNVPRGITPVRYGHISPRVGFALDPWGNAKTSVRGGVGLYWGSVAEEMWDIGGNGSPFALQYAFPNTSSLSGSTLTNPYQGNSNPFPYTGNIFPFGVNMGGISRNADWPETVQTNLSIQQQLTPNLGITVAFVGSYSSNQAFSIDINYPALNANYAAALGTKQCGTSATITPSVSNAQCRRPIQPFGSWGLAESNFRTSYNGLQVSATKHMSRHFSISGYYSWSKAISDVPLQSGQITVGRGGGVQDFNNLKAERSRTANDLTNQAVISAIWQPMVPTQQRLVRAVLNGWEIAPIVSLHTGAPFSVLNGVDANLDGNSGSDRAQLIGNPHSGSHSLNQWFNTAAFARNTAVAGAPVDGNSPPYFLNSPAFHNVDMTLARTFPLHEQINLQLRAEGLNAFNIASYQTPGNTAGTGTFGIIQSANTMREIQLGAKINF